MTATDSDILSTSLVFVVYIGLSGEPNNNTPTPPPSQTNWNIAITAVDVPSSGNATVVWQSVDGVTYDLYSSASPIGANPSWSKVVTGQEADGILSTASVSSAGSAIFYQVVPQGQSRTDRGIWGIVRPSISSGIALLSPPLVGDRRFDQTFGEALAAAVPTGTKVHIMTSAAPTWQILERNASSQWRTSPGNAVYSTPLGDGQGFFIEGASGSTPVFSGPVGNDGSSGQTILNGFNLLGVSEGKGLAVASAFSTSTMDPDPVGNASEALADQIVIQNSNGTWRRLVRLSNGTWYDMSAAATATVTLMPGQAYYYIRRNTDSTVSF